MNTKSLLVLNCGSTSIKFALYGWSGEETPKLLARGALDLSVTPPSLQILNFEKHAAEKLSNEISASFANSMEFAAIAIKLAETFQNYFPHYKLSAVAHRVVHGGALRKTAEKVSPALIADLARFTNLAPLHQPANLAPISAISAAYPTLLQIACFDTAFHCDQPSLMQMTGLPRSYYERGIRRMGFHGLSYNFVVTRIAELTGYVPKRLIAAHLGGGASVCGMLEGVSVSCSMGTTVLDGLPMATRSGSIDPGLLLNLLESETMSVMQMRTMLYEQSGLLGVSGISGDMRELISNPLVAAQDAIEFFVQRTAREIAATAADLGGIDALVLTGGIGENQPAICQNICEKLTWLGVSVASKHKMISLETNAHIDRRIDDSMGRVTVWVLHTDEVLVMCKEAISLIESAGHAT
jgi:acetate kinase